jgi:catechol 2,3-dioxygenase-like lactoylglutathione lyase family enzyme
MAARPAAQVEHPLARPLVQDVDQPITVARHESERGTVLVGVPGAVRHHSSQAHQQRRAAAGSVPGMPIKLENVAIAVRDLEAAISFFTDLGLTVLGRDTVRGQWTDTAVGLDGNHARIAMLQTPDGIGRLELFEYLHPAAIETEPTRPNEIGMHRVAFSVDDLDASLEIAARHGCHPLRGVATYQDAYRLTYVRGPSGIIVMLAQALAPG